MRLPLDACACRYKEERHHWHANIATTPTLNRCLPSTRATHEEVTLCAYPTCDLVGKACYTSQFPDAKYWQPSASELTACEQVLTLTTTRSVGPRGAELELEFLKTLYGGVLGATTDVYLGGLELLLFGVLAALMLNFALMFVLRHFVKTLFYATVVLLLLALFVVDAVAFARAGRLQLPQLTEQTIGTLGGGFVAASRGGGALNAHLTDEPSATGGEAGGSLSALSGAAASVAAHPIFSVAAEEAQTRWLIGGYVAVGVHIGVLLFIIVLWNKVDNALEICREATKAVFDNRALLVLPLLSTAVSAGVMAHFLLVLVHILTPDAATITTQIDDITHSLAAGTVALANDATDAAIDITSKAIDGANELAKSALHDDIVDVQLHDINIDGGAWANANATGVIDPSYVAYGAIGWELFASLWALFFVDAVVYCTIAGAITYWYQEREGKGVVPALWRVLRYHLGSMALGAAVLSATSIFQRILMYIDATTRANRDNGLVRLTMCCCDCCLRCYDKCLRLLTKFAHVFVAAEGYPFCAAAVKTFTLVSKHPLQMLTNEATLGVLSLLLTMLAPLGCAILSYFAVLHEWRNSLLLLANLGFASRELQWADGIATPERLADLDRSLASTVGRLPDWSITGPPDALTVACATLFVAFWITQMFRMVYAATVDTLFVCMFRDDDFLAGKYSSTAPSTSASASAGPSRASSSRGPSLPNTPVRAPQTVR